jgi:two-component system, chemotaxis family, CheB/CheR fusion protein
MKVTWRICYSLPVGCQCCRSPKPPCWSRTRFFVIPPGANLNSIDTHLRLTDLEEPRRIRAPIDNFFRTLAQTHDGHAIGVILTGTGSDGALGIKQIKEMGGLTVVQDPEEAEFEGMPCNAIATGVVNLVLPLAAIPAHILRYAHTEPNVPMPQEPGEEEHDQAWLQQDFLQHVFTQVGSSTGRDFSHYKSSTIMRRIRRRMQIHQIEDPEKYVALLREHANEARLLSDEFLITVSSFFRDREVVGALEKTIIPRLLESKGRSDTVRVWSVGCATGEEAYSLAILLQEAISRMPDPPRIQVFASDMHERSLHMAREGYYTGDIQSDVSTERLGRFFTQENGIYRIRRELRELVIFAPHNLMSDPPFSKMDLISCRNVFIYLQRDVQQHLVRLFHYAMVPNGWLLLGTSETVDLSDLFNMEHKQFSLFRKRNPHTQPTLPHFPILRSVTGGGRPAHRPSQAPVSYGSLHQRMVERYAPPSVLVSQDHNVVHLSEHAGKYMIRPGGEPTNSVFEGVREELRSELRATVLTAQKENRACRSRPVLTHIEGQTRLIILDVRPSERGFFLVIFNEHDPETTIHERENPEQPTSSNLVEELEAGKLRLQTIVQDYESS